MTVFFFIIILMACYLIGSIPSGYLIGKAFKGINIREFGSGNIGFTNVLRVIGIFPALIVLIMDITKGIISVYTGLSLAPFTKVDPQIMAGIAGLLSIAGHNWSVFIKFRGGKGVAITAGVFSILTPLPFFLSVLVMMGTVTITRYVSLGSIVAAGSLPFFIWFWLRSNSQFYLVMSTIAALLILFKHRSNIERLLKNKERKIGEKVKV